MNHQATYDALIRKAQARGKPAGYSERHHIKPKALGGKNSQDNLVALTAREHFVAHLLLAKIHGGGMAYAALAMARGNRRVKRDYKIGSRTYEWLKRDLSHTKEAAAKIAASKFGRTIPQEVRDKISASKKNKSHSAEHVAKVAAANRGKKRAFKSPQLGQKLSPETRAKMSAAAYARWANR